MKVKIVLVDASPYVFRAYYSIPSSMVDRQGRPSGAVYGFTRFMVRLLADEAPSHVAVAFDESLTTSFRNEIYPPYKQQRELPPAELEAQFAGCQDVVRALGVTALADRRFEADDLIGTLCHRLSDRNLPIVVVSPDKDLAQLVTDRITLHDPPRGPRHSPDSIVATYGVRPPQIPDYLGLAGDAVDNIPGIRGIGSRTASRLLAHFADLDDLFARLDEVASLPLRGASSMLSRLREGRESALLSRELARISREAPVSADLEELRYHGAKRSRVESVFDGLAFGSLWTKVRFRPEPVPGEGTGHGG